MNKINNEPHRITGMEAWNRQWPEKRGEWHNGGKKGKGLDREHVWMTH